MPNSRGHQKCNVFCRLVLIFWKTNWSLELILDSRYCQVTRKRRKRGIIQNQTFIGSNWLTVKKIFKVFKNVTLFPIDHILAHIQSFLLYCMNIYMQCIFVFTILLAFYDLSEINYLNWIVCSYVGEKLNVYKYYHLNWSICSL